MADKNGDTTTDGPWTRLLKATYAVLDLWDSGASFDTAEAEDVMDDLAGTSSAVDLEIAIITDRAIFGRND